jgi:hypothetical protein
MKWQLALLGAGIAGVVAILVVAIAGNRNPVVGDLRDCLREGRAQVIRTQDALGIARADIGAGTLEVTRRFEAGDDTGVVLRPRGTDRYALVILRNPENPPFADDIARQLFDDPSLFSVVGIEVTPVRGVVAGCVDALERRHGA